MVDQQTGFGWMKDDPAYNAAPAEPTLQAEPEPTVVDYPPYENTCRICRHKNDICPDPFGHEEDEERYNS